MTLKPSNRFQLVVFLIIIICFPLLVTAPILLHAIEKPFDIYHLKKFAQKITVADRIVASYSQSSVTFSLTGQEAKQVIAAVSSAKPDRNTYKCLYNAKAQFFNGTNNLGDVIGCSTILWITGRQYKEDTGVWDKLVNGSITITQGHQI